MMTTPELNKASSAPAVLKTKATEAEATEAPAPAKNATEATEATACNTTDATTPVVATAAAPAATKTVVTTADKAVTPREAELEAFFTKLRTILKGGFDTRDVKYPRPEGGRGQLKASEEFFAAVIKDDFLLALELSSFKNAEMRLTPSVGAKAAETEAERRIFELRTKGESIFKMYRYTTERMRAMAIALFEGKDGDIKIAVACTGPISKRKLVACTGKKA